ncbi:unnamed protein product [Durusdinium trenchii]|uniref:Uncharacterized protein n=1 Tax=Durusdinium trenchii TaxID=1381693 RepID=A0ABP0IDL8_9DINO
MAFSMLVATIVSATAEPAFFDSNAFGSGQLRGLGSDPFADPGRQNKWLKDISTSTKNYFKKVLAPLQKPIVQEYQVLTILDQYANYTMDKVENATGSDVIWNRTSRFLQEVAEDPDESAEPSAKGRALYSRRRRGNQDLPPRARYINKILIYLNQEMDLLWNYNTIVDRKRWGVGNTITSSPYGPHGEHPERWRANGSYPMPKAAPNHTILLQEDEVTITIRVKADEKKFDNKYAVQLQADYFSLVDNINDASQKISDLRTRLWKMNDYADQFIALPSGVWNKIDAQA